MSKKNQFKSDDISHMMAYVLGHKPFEFGLLPDAAGFVSIRNSFNRFMKSQDGAM